MQNKNSVVNQLIDSYHKGYRHLDSGKTYNYTLDTLLYDLAYLYQDVQEYEKNLIESVFMKQFDFETLVKVNRTLNKVSFDSNLHRIVAQKLISLATSKEHWYVLVKNDIPNPSYADQTTLRGLVKDVALEKILKQNIAPTLDDAYYVFQNALPGTHLYQTALHYVNTHQ